MKLPDPAPSHSTVAPRRTELHRTSGLPAYQKRICELIEQVAPARRPDLFVIVPSRAAAEQLRRTLEGRSLRAAGDVLLPPRIGPRGDWYAALAQRLAPAPRLLTPFEREVLLTAGTEAAEADGMTPPFTLRPSLVAEMLALYDQLRRLRRRVDDFERNLNGLLADSVEVDRGAAKLLQQTRFLAHAYREYERRAGQGASLDEHRLRAALLAQVPRRPVTHVIVTVGDHASEGGGLWPDDWDLLTRIPGVARVDLVSTSALLDAGLLERLQALLPELLVHPEVPAVTAGPALEVPAQAQVASPETLSFSSRDREQELAAAARRIKRDWREEAEVELPRIGLVVQRPLPYVYLARQVFEDASISLETTVGLPLAAEPYAAAVDLLLEAVILNFPRRLLAGVLTSPHFQFVHDGQPLEAAAVACLDRALAAAHYEGAPGQLAAYDQVWRAANAEAGRTERRQKQALPALEVARALIDRLGPLQEPGPAAQQISTLIDALLAWDAGPSGNSAMDGRRDAARTAVLGILAGLRAAYDRHHPGAVLDAAALSRMLRRWLESRTMLPDRAVSGVLLLEPEAARYGVFDDLFLLGLVDGEWPPPTRGNVLYPASLLQNFEPEPPLPRAPGDLARTIQRQNVAALHDLASLPRRRLRVSTFALDEDLLTEPSPLLDALATAHLSIEAERPSPPARIFRHEAVAAVDTDAHRVLSGAVSGWAALRKPLRAGEHFRGEAGPWLLPRVSVSRLERYLDCPFQFFASEVLRLEEEPEDAAVETPLERGRRLHALLERFFREWPRQHSGPLRADTLPQARALFARLIDETLAPLPRAEAALERARLLGSAVDAGIVHRVLAAELGQDEETIERLLEYRLEGTFHFADRAGQPRAVPLAGVADRIDLRRDRTFRIVDYKSKTTRDPKTALQLPVYGVCAQAQLAGHGGHDWRLADAVYVSLEGERTVVPLKTPQQTFVQLVRDAEARVLDTLDAIAAGHFPPSPAKRSQCGTCSFSVVCRRDYVEEKEDE